jgi:probable rRNA maturation factor
MTKENRVLVWNNDQDEFEIKSTWTQLLKELLHIAADEERLAQGEVALTFVDDETIRELNLQYRNIDKATDVLSFSMLELGEGELPITYDEDMIEPLGDIVISVRRAAEQAAEYGHSIERELGFLFVHGFLHLLGYDHQDDEAEKIMIAKQESVLEKAGLSR